MQPDASPIPHTIAQWFGLAVATLLAALGGWLARRKREPVELDKLRAETKSIHITAENAQASIGLETLREIQNVIQKAEQRREEWLRREDEMRNQTIFWRSKAEGLDGELIDSRDANVQLTARLKVKEDALTKAMALIHFYKVPYQDADLPEVRIIIDKLRMVETKELDRHEN